MILSLTRATLAQKKSMQHSEGQATYAWISPVFPIQQVCCQLAYLCCLVLLIFQQEVANSLTLLQGVFQSRILLNDYYRFLIPLGQPAASTSTPHRLQDLAVIARQMVMHNKPGGSTLTCDLQSSMHATWGGVSLHRGSRNDILLLCMGPLSS